MSSSTGSPPGGSTGGSTDPGLLAAATRIAIYFAKPYAAWQRGTNEHTNGLVRQYFPKGTRFTDISHAAVARAQTQLNHRPRKRLGYRTPQETLFQTASETILD